LRSAARTWITNAELKSGVYAGFTEAAHHERLITQVGVRFNGYGVPLVKLFRR
jgi:hypothetical protein